MAATLSPEGLIANQAAQLERIKADNRTHNLAYAAFYVAALGLTAHRAITKKCPRAAAAFGVAAWGTYWSHDAYVKTGIAANPYYDWAKAHLGA